MTVYVHRNNVHTETDMATFDRSTEFKLFAMAQTELLAAVRTNDARIARQAREELEGIEMHTDWASLRVRCAAVLHSTQH